MQTQLPKSIISRSPSVFPSDEARALASFIAASSAFPSYYDVSESEKPIKQIAVAPDDVSAAHISSASSGREEVTM